MTGTRKLSQEEVFLVEKPRSGRLRREANDATRRSGWGRIKHEDGTYEDIAPHKGGIARTILDGVVSGCMQDFSDDSASDDDAPAFRMQ